MKGIISKKIGPYDGPHTKGMITFKIQTKNGLLTWHEDGTRGLKDAKVGETYDGFEVIPTNEFNYGKSKRQLKIINEQQSINFN